ncbi:cytochrome c3 family protein [Pseudoteredinibacter isoporae]|uniref:cytochrome c3 family protein n=1 Tax=Pseudoteredinibacter isoporae TaxID=570281 RepID=UPI003106B3EA
MWSPAKVVFTVTALLAIIVFLVFFPQKRESSLREAPLLDVYFVHKDHHQVGCAQCHHNYVDGTGRQFGCYQCHKEDESVNLLVEEQFHGLCRECHRERKAAGEESGPIRQCGGCHKPDTKP